MTPNGRRRNQANNFWGLFLSFFPFLPSIPIPSSPSHFPFPFFSLCLFCPFEMDSPVQIGASRTHISSQSPLNTLFRGTSVSVKVLASFGSLSSGSFFPKMLTGPIKMLLSNTASLQLIPAKVRRLSPWQRRRMKKRRCLAEFGHFSFDFLGRGGDATCSLPDCQSGATFLLLLLQKQDHAGQGNVGAKSLIYIVKIQDLGIQAIFSSFFFFFLLFQN